MPTLDYQSQKRPRWEFPWPHLIGLALVLALIVFVLVPTLNRPRRGDHALGRCQSNLRQIAQACYLYANDNGGHLPPRFSLLFETQDLGLECAVCDLTSTTRPTTLPSDDWFDQNSDIVYLGAGLTSAAPGTIIVAHERLPNHAGHTVAYLDMTSARLTPTALKAELSRSNALRAQWEATTRPATQPAPTR